MKSNLFSPLFSESTPDEMLSGPATTSDDCAGRVRLPTPEPEGSGAPSEIRFSHVHNSISSEASRRLRIGNVWDKGEVVPPF